MTFEPPSLTWIVLYPQIVLVIAGLVVMLLDSFSERGRKGHIGYVAIIGILAFAVVSLVLWGIHTTGFEGMIILDTFALFMNQIFSLAAVLTILVSLAYVKREGIPEGEYYALILFAVTGMSLLANAGNLLVVFLGLEIMSISAYILTSIVRERLHGNEAGLKYFLMGAFASSFLLYGIALIFGATGSLDLHTIGETIQTYSLQHTPLIFIGFCLILVGFAFKIALVPFHMWLPDVYQGAPSPVTGFMATAVKAAGFAAILRMFTQSFSALQIEWQSIIWVLAILTMTLGNITALVQNNIKRMLAYSAIAHAGYLVVGLITNSHKAFGAMLFYLVAYTLMNVGAFAVVIIFERKGEENLDIDDYRGLATRYPVIALVMSLFMFSLAGIPPTAGFIGKLAIFAEAVRAGYIGLTIVAVLNSVLSVYYYLRVIVNMYMKPRETEPPMATYDAPHLVALTIAAIGTLVLGIIPAYLLHWATRCFTSGF